MENKISTRVKVSDLRKGDVLSITGETVDWSYNGANTREDHNEVRVINPDGVVRHAEWLRNTVVTVIR